MAQPSTMTPALQPPAGVSAQGVAQASKLRIPGSMSEFYARGGLENTYRTAQADIKKQRVMQNIKRSFEELLKKRERGADIVIADAVKVYGEGARSFLPPKDLYYDPKTGQFDAYKWMERAYIGLEELEKQKTQRAGAKQFLGLVTPKQEETIPGVQAVPRPEGRSLGAPGISIPELPVTTPAKYPMTPGGIARATAEVAAEQGPEVAKAVAEPFVTAQSEEGRIAKEAGVAQRAAKRIEISEAQLALKERQTNQRYRMFRQSQTAADRRLRERLEANWINNFDPIEEESNMLDYQSSLDKNKSIAKDPNSTELQKTMADRNVFKYKMLIKRVGEQLKRYDAYIGAETGGAEGGAEGGGVQPGPRSTSEAEARLQAGIAKVRASGATEEEIADFEQRYRQELGL